jgi:acetyltransferase-like isoleucine patch superfamily enzyme
MNYRRIQPWAFRVAWGIVRRLPTRYGARIRVHILVLFGATVGSRVSVGPGCHVLEPRGLSIGGDSGIARDVTIDARGGLTIGCRTLIGFESVLLTYTHSLDEETASVSLTDFVAQPTEIGDGCWIGTRVIVLPGLSVGSGSIVGAGAVVTKTVPAGTVAGGVPARPL